MTTEEKAEAYDLLRDALINVYSSGLFAWVCGTPCGGNSHDTLDAAELELLAWAQREAPARRAKVAKAQAVTTDQSAEGGKAKSSCAASTASSAVA